MSDLVARIVADLIKGAQEAGGNVEIATPIGHEVKLASFTEAKLNSARQDGAKAAADKFKIKEAFLGPLLGLGASVAAPSLARAGLGRLAGGAGGQMLKGLAGKIMPHIGGRLGGAAFDAATGMAGGALANRLMGGDKSQYSPMGAGAAGLVGGQLIQRPEGHGPWL